MKYKANDITIAIVTRNRPDHLKHLLCSLLSQSQTPSQIVVIDGSEDLSTRKICFSFVRAVSIPITYIKNDNGSTIYGRNKAIKFVSTEWLCFLDDDTVADFFWFESVNNAVNHHKNAQVIFGNVATYFSSNIFSIATDCDKYVWKMAGMGKRKISDLEIIDTKNCVINIPYLRKNKIMFSDDRTVYKGSSCEDSDFGMQLKEKNAVAYYDDKIKVFHKDSVTLLVFLKKSIYSLLAHKRYEEKWRAFRKKNSRKSLIRGLRDKVHFFVEYKEKHSLSYSNFIIVCSLLLFVKSVVYLDNVGRSILKSYSIS